VTSFQATAGAADYNYRLHGRYLKANTIVGVDAGLISWIYLKLTGEYEFSATMAG
jgi:hypothetical protein